MLVEKKAEYQSGGMDKNQYFREMFEVHRHLFEYPSLISNSPIKNITITSDGVLFTISNNGIDITVCCDERDSHALPMSYLNFATYESAEMSMVLRLIKPGDTVFDIGANIGWYTLNILLGRPGTKVYSIEPIRASYQYLLKNLSLNCQATGYSYNIGFSDRNTTARFYFDIKCAMASSMANLREDENTVMVECEVIKMDDFAASIKTLDRLDFIKCDVEGAELLVFKGAIETISRYKPVIFTEMLRKWSKKFGYHPNDIIYLLRGVGYECFTIDNDKLAPFGLVYEETVQTNYIFLHEEKHKSTINLLV